MKGDKYGNFILTTAGAGLRCGRYIMTLKRRRPKNIRDIGYHEGKMYAYLWVCTCFGYVHFLDRKDPLLKTKIKPMKKWINIFPSLKWGFLIIMKPDFFEAVMNFELKSHSEREMDKIGKLAVNKIRSKCSIIK